MIYISLANKLRKRINSNEFPLNSPLPSEKILAEDYGVSRMTLRKAIDCLVKDGLVVRRHGSGNYIVDREILHETRGLHSLTEQINKTNKSLTSKVLKFSMIPCPVSVAKQLKIQFGESVYYIIRLRFLDDVPVQYEESYLPVKRYPTLSIAHMEKSKFAYIENEAGEIIEGNTFTFQPVLTPASIAVHLKIKEGDPMMQVTSISNAPDGSILDFSITTENVHHYQSIYFFRRQKMR